MLYGPAQVTSSGEQHGMVNILSNAVQGDGYANMAPPIKAKVEKQKKEDARLVKVKYINMRNKHERLDKPYCKYAGDPILMYHLIPNHVYDLPKGFVDEVNGVKMPKRSGLVSEDDIKINADGSPLQTDIEGDSLHLLVPATF